MIGVVRYWKPIVLALVIAVVCTAWRIDRAKQYKAGEVSDTARMSAALAEAHGKQTWEVLEKERQDAALMKEEQTKIEKERQHAKTVIAGLRGELGRLQQYAESQRGRANLPTAPATTGTLDDEALARGWALFGKCAAEYVGVAEVADEQRNDLAEWQAYGRVVGEGVSTSIKVD